VLVTGFFLVLFTGIFTAVSTDITIEEDCFIGIID
jgi:hypothetical protein